MKNLLLSLLCVLLAGSALSAAKKPNIICILVDDLGYSDLSSFGGKDIKTPAIDKLMGAGMRFDQFYANCTVCTPTRASPMTGRYPDLVGAPESSGKMLKAIGDSSTRPDRPCRVDEQSRLPYGNGRKVAFGLRAPQFAQ